MNFIREYRETETSFILMRMNIGANSEIIYERSTDSTHENFIRSNYDGTPYYSSCLPSNCKVMGGFTKIKFLDHINHLD
jgi:hypothetical protein